MRLLLIAIALLAAAAAPQEPSRRVEVPIREVRLSDGVIRYGIPMRIGGTEVLAGIDTGAAGLRVMPDALPKSAVTGGTAPQTYAFGSGARLTGTVGRARIEIGGLIGEASLHQVEKVDCEPRASPNCPGRLGLGYGFLGDGLPKEGFRVLLGGNMGRTSIDHPLTAVGARRWIIELPQPGEAGGRLILNPTDAELAGFTMVRLAGGFREQEGGGLHDSVPGCLRGGSDRVCGLITLDTGAFALRVLNARPAPRWPEGSALTLEFRGDDGKPVAPTPLTAGKLAQRVVIGTAPRRETILQLGTAPYFAYAVLYDPVGGRLGFKAR